jgi:hypothetical protein
MLRKFICFPEVKNHVSVEERLDFALLQRYFSKQLSYSPYKGEAACVLS